MDVPKSIPFEAVILNEVKESLYFIFVLLSAVGTPTLIPL
jgi:hypothetical protein